MARCWRSWPSFHAQRIRRDVSRWLDHTRLWRTHSSLSHIGELWRYSAWFWSLAHIVGSGYQTEQDNCAQSVVFGVLETCSPIWVRGIWFCVLSWRDILAHLFLVMKHCWTISNMYGKLTVAMYHTGITTGTTLVMTHDWIIAQDCFSASDPVMILNYLLCILSTTCMSTLLSILDWP